MQADVLRHHVEHRRREGHAEHRSEGLDLEAGSAKEKAESQACVEPCASRADAHGLAPENEHSAGQMVAEGGEDVVDQLAGVARKKPCAPEPRERTKQRNGQTQAHSARRGLNAVSRARKPPTAPITL